MHPLENLAGNDAALFLFRFDISGNGINFVLNEGIAADMYDDVDEKLLPLVQAGGDPPALSTLERASRSWTALS